MAATKCGTASGTTDRQRAIQRSYWRGHDYTGRFTRAVTPASWQEKMDELARELHKAITANNGYRAELVQRAIDDLKSRDQEAHDRSLGLIP